MLALNVRTNHVHSVVQATGRKPELVLNYFKSWATRRLREIEYRAIDARIWTEGGSTRWINNEAGLRGAMDYELNQQ